MYVIGCFIDAGYSVNCSGTVYGIVQRGTTYIAVGGTALAQKKRRLFTPGLAFFFLLQRRE